MQDSLFELRFPLVNGSRIRQARELRGMTQAVLAAEVCVDQTMIAHIERGTKQPNTDLLEAITSALEFPPAFFRQQDCIEMTMGSLLFRSKAVVGKRVLAQAHEHSRLALEFALRLSEYASLIPINVPAYTDPLEAAREVRLLMNIPGGPLTDVLRHTERLGVLILPLPDIRDCDAFATWAGPLKNMPIIGLASGRPPDRVRLSAAHELGHLVLHRSLNATSKYNEEEAYIFASELLMPAADITDDLMSQKISLFRLAELKKKWQVSMQAIARRARQLQAINDRQYRYIMMQISQRGWRMEEPVFQSIAQEQPRALRKLAEVAFDNKIDWKKKAIEFNLDPEFVLSLLSQCAPSPTKTTSLPQTRGGTSPKLIQFAKQK